MSLSKTMELTTECKSLMADPESWSLLFCERSSSSGCLLEPHHFSYEGSPEKQTHMHAQRRWRRMPLAGRGDSVHSSKVTWIRGGNCHISCSRDHFWVQPDLLCQNNVLFSCWRQLTTEEVQKTMERRVNFQSLGCAYANRDRPNHFFG